MLHEPHSISSKPTWPTSRARYTSAKPLEVSLSNWMDGTCLILSMQFWAFARWRIFLILERSLPTYRLLYLKPKDKIMLMTVTCCKISSVNVDNTHKPELTTEMGRLWRAVDIVTAMRSIRNWRRKNRYMHELQEIRPMLTDRFSLGRRTLKSQVLTLEAQD